MTSEEALASVTAKATRTEDITTWDEVQNRLKSLSISGGAWIASRWPYSMTIHFYRFQSPCRVPDQYYDGCQGQIGWRGQIVQFTKAARRREQNRGFGSD